MPVTNFTTYVYWIGHYSWLVVLLALGLHCLWLWHRVARASLRAPALKRGDIKLILALTGLFALPTLIMGLGIVSGHVPDLWAYGRFFEGNPFVLSYGASIIVLDAFLILWVFALGGDHKLAPHLPALHGLNSHALYHKATPKAVRASALSLVCLQLFGLWLRANSQPPTFPF
jgi:hypothetical protein